MDNHSLKHLRPTYARIDLNKLVRNAIKARQLSSSEIIATVKADAYGHGALRCSQALYEKAGVKIFSVATISEAIELRKLNDLKNCKILVLGYIHPMFFNSVLEYNITPVIYDANTAKSFNDFLAEQDVVKYEIGLKCDTGMSRLGFAYDTDMNEFSSKFPNLNVSLVMSHIAEPTNKDFSTEQETRFKKFASAFPSAKTSLFASQSILTMNNCYNYTRPGIILYGGYVEGGENFEAVMSMYSVVVHTSFIKKGGSIGYGRSFIADRDMWVGVVPVGYADGYPRQLSNKGYVFIDNLKCAILGRVCMDMIMVDITHFGATALKKEVELIGDNISAKEIADIVGTIDYEILCQISHRVARVY